MKIKELIENGHYEILKEDKISLNLEVLEIIIFYKTLAPLSIFEKFIIKVIEQAYKNNISLVQISNEEKIVDVDQIAKILSIDYEIVEKNINELSKSNLIEINNGKLVVKWDNNLKKWEKEIFEEVNEKLYFRDLETLEKFDTLPIEEIAERYSNSKKIFDSFEIINRKVEEISIKSFILLDKDSFELKIIFENNNKLLTFSDELTQVNKIKNITEQELIIIEKDKMKNNSKIQFSEEQLAVINSREKYILLKARAGSGKTAVIVERTKQLLKEGINEDEILLLAFNKKASLEMNERIGNGFQNAKTFHSLAKSFSNLGSTKIKPMQ